MRGFRSLLVLAAVLVGLLAYVYFVEWRRSPDSAADAKEKVFDVESSDIEVLTITSTSGETTLEKRDVGWDLTAPKAIKADVTEVSSIVNGLASLEIQRVVEQAPEELAPYGLAEPRIEVAFKTEPDQEPLRLRVGDKTATGGDLYAMRDGEPRVFLISGYLETTFNRSAFDLQDKTILTIDTQSIDSLEITAADLDIALDRTEGNWRLVRPLQARADYGTAQGLVGRLTTSQMKSIAADTPEDLAPFGLDAPSASISLVTGSARATLELGGAAPDGTIYARDVSKPAVFTVDASLLDELKKPPTDFRNKDLFQFRPFNATRVEITRDGETAVYEKVEGAGEEKKTVWRQDTPTARDIEADKMETALSGMSNLRALYFAEPGVKTGLETPVATVVVRYEDGKLDRVTFGKDEEDVYAAVEGEPGAARVDTKDYTLAFKSLDDLE